MSEKKVYTNTKNPTPLITVISSGCVTPPLEIKFSTLVKPFYYPNSPTIPRYSITCVVDPEAHKEFLTGLQTIEKNEGVDSIIKAETVKEKNEHFQTGKALIKFQSKDKIPIYLKNSVDDPNEQEIVLEDELARGEKVCVEYDILRYTKKNTLKTEHGLSFKCTKIIYFPSLNDDEE